MKYNKIFISALLPIALLTSCSKPTTISLETSKVATGDIFETVTATGTVESVTQVDVGTQVTGIISKLYVDYNSEVKQGELIAEIEQR
jgi:HlyD family secretion protein